MGYPFGESGEPIYYMLETHYDNPSLVEGLTFETGLNFYYTSDLRLDMSDDLQVHSDL